MRGETVKLIVVFQNLVNPPENHTRHITCTSFYVTLAVWLKFPFLWNVTLHQFITVYRCFEANFVIVFKGLNV
jgi:hypothetical protein